MLTNLYSIPFNESSVTYYFVVINKTRKKNIFYLLRKMTGTVSFYSLLPTIWLVSSKWETHQESGKDDFVEATLIYFTTHYSGKIFCGFLPQNKFIVSLKLNVSLQNLRINAFVLLTVYWKFQSNFQFKYCKSFSNAFQGCIMSVSFRMRNFSAMSHFQHMRLTFQLLRMTKFHLLASSLVDVVNHLGTLENEHYWAFIKKSVPNKWLKY